ncbi:DUF5615 family PIN-like protein [Granulicella tundricola]|uniref:DUF5615 domain-containing protein n=1 Tax=Granulicella tundricola (strain ATCC BAA-1859 / DSM 23138 / MP5ACTX9) TaxID=1198114 RepID=E8X0T8_GRATM|nr:DUF5615 family PIN-like protein [Granulicella tundricola]ADW70122.1 hypothetical protein AciX9_3105 [Granulicella tundricola MP5ACTX9]
MQKLLIDENLSPSLIGQANDKGFVCSHVNYLGLTGRKDWELKAAILDGDWTFITNNGVDFRGPAKKPGSQGVYANISLHAGLICIDAPGGLNMESQKRLFDLVLFNLEEHATLTNQVLQVTLSPDGSVELSRYGMPASI